MWPVFLGMQKVCLEKILQSCRFLVQLLVCSIIFSFLWLRLGISRAWQRGCYLQRPDPCGTHTRPSRRVTAQSVGLAGTGWLKGAER